jgi:probable HAF family extracellular repeat protein
MRRLGALPGDDASEARAINVTGHVVGRSGAADFSRSRAVLWQGGVPVDLNSIAAAPGWALSSATGINDVGQVVGVGLRDGQIRAFRLDPQ